MTATDSISDRQRALGAELSRARSLTDSLFSRVRPEALLSRPIPERNRLIFYLGHVEAFDWNLIPSGALGVPSPSPELDQLLAFGIDPTDGELPDDRPEDWPAESIIRDYNARVRAAVDAALGRVGDPGAPANLRDGTLVHVGIEHRLMHAETLAYLLRQLDDSAKRGELDEAAPARRGSAPPIEIPPGTAVLGRPRATARERFGWDNEFGELRTSVDGFVIDSANVSNRDFLAFVEGGGYRDRSLWSESGWRWKEQRGLVHPLCWVTHNGAFRWRGILCEQPLDLDAPVFVSHAEASAYARSVGKALPTEAQLHRAAYGDSTESERPHPWGSNDTGSDDAEAQRGNFGFVRWEPAPTGSYPAGDSPWGVRDLIGNGWEWTSTPFAPFPDFEPYPFYRGYSSDFFDDHHFVVFGGGPRTDASMVRRTFRNWFQPHYPYADTAFRCVVPR